MLTAVVKRRLHAAWVGAWSGVLTYIASVVAGGHFPGFEALAVGVLVTAVSRGGGAFLSSRETAPPVTVVS